MLKSYAALLGKTVQRLARIRGGGSALPGFVVEKIDPNFIRRTLSQLPHGVVVVSGTNGKTTTTKMVVELLESQDLKVFTNRTGSNFTRGVASALLNATNWQGKIDFDIAVLELDEAHAVLFVKDVSPRYTLLLNVMRDQLDRFGEIDTTAKLLAQIAEKTTHTVVLNREDSRVAAIASQLQKGQKVSYFGLDKEVAELFPNDDDMFGSSRIPSDQIPSADVLLSKVDDDLTQFTIDGRLVTAPLEVKGIYNAYNAAAALALTRTILGEKIDESRLITVLSQLKPAFGRGETLVVDGQPLELVLVKNPSGFRLSLSSFKPNGYQTMIAINDNYADSRDVSWLWDVEFSSLRTNGVSVVSGVRAHDMALRLHYDEVKTIHTEPNLNKALEYFIANTKGQAKRIYCTYTAMLSLRRELSKITNVDVIS